MFMILPYQVDVPMARWPISNFVLIAAISAVSIAIWAGAIPKGLVMAMVLDGWSPVGMIGSNFVHGDHWHLVGNMVFLWVFGNAICAKVGNLAYPALFFAFGLAGSTAHNLFDGGTAIGASAAINGVVGMFLFWYAFNDISCVWLFLIRVGAVTVSSYWIILLFVAFDLWGVASGGAGIAYVAHLGGFFAGLGAALALYQSRLVLTGDLERDLFDLFRGERYGRRRRVKYEADGELGPEVLKNPIAAASPVRSGPIPMEAEPPSFIRFNCAGCGHALKVAATHAGKRGRCPGCREMVQIPPA